MVLLGKSLTASRLSNLVVAAVLYSVWLKFSRLVVPSP